MNAPLNSAIDIALRRVYKDTEINIRTSCKEMKELLLICTKNVHFSCNRQLYLQMDGVAMDSPLGRVITGIF